MARKLRVTPAPPYAYRPGKTVLHRAPAAGKAAAMLGISSAPFLFGLPALGGGAGVIILGALAAGIRPWELLRGIRPLGVTLILIVLYRSVTLSPPGVNRTGCLASLLLTGNILVSFSAGALFFSVTTMTELLEFLDSRERALARLLSAALRRIPACMRPPLPSSLEPLRIGLGISLMLGFLPRFFERWETAHCAYRARGGRGGIRPLFTLIPLVTEGMIETALETAAALESRGIR